MQKNKFKIFSMFFLTIAFTCCINISFAAEAELKSLDVNISLNSNGSMNVEETWNADMENTNTLFKNYTINKERYSSISNVRVYEILKDGSLKEFGQIYEELTKVPDGYFYAMNIKNNLYEIAWGVGTSFTGNKKYLIKYTVNDVVKIYKDTADIFWPILGDDFELKINSITGSITLPGTPAIKDMVRVWAHGPLQGNIQIVADDKIEFSVKNYDSKEYVEIRVLAPTALFKDTPLTEDTEMFLDIIEEERELAERANRMREAKAKIGKIFLDLFLIITGFLSIVIITRIVKYKKYLKEMERIVPTQKLDYFRELPRKTATPAESLFISNLYTLDLKYSIAPIISATLLDLCIKNHIAFETNEKNKINIILKNTDSNNLKKHEQSILNLLSSTKSKEENIITMKEFEKQIQKTFSDYLKAQQFMNEIEDDVRDNLISEGILDMDEYTKSKKWYTRFVLYLILGIFTLPIIYLSIPAIICSVQSHKILKNNMGFTQKGIDEKEAWNGLKKYMIDFSLLNEKEVPSIIIWEEFLVYATAFGIADKVIKQLKIAYPDFDTNSSLSNSSYIYMLANSSTGTNFISSINNSVIGSMSSGSGHGGGFSGGAGGSGVGGGGGAR